MDIEALRSFIAFAETGSFTRAGEQVYRTQSAISQQMKKLEQETGQRLFARQGRRQTLSRQGEFLLAHARRIVEAHDQALRDVKNTLTAPAWRIGCPDDYLQTLLPRLVAAVHRYWPELLIELHCHHSQRLRTMIDAGELDAAIVTCSSGQGNGYFLYQDKAVWAAGSPAQLSALLRQPFLPLVLFDASCHFHQTAVEGLSRLKVTNKVIFSSTSRSGIEALVLDGQGITVVAECSLGQMRRIWPEEMPFTLPPLPDVQIDLVAAAKAHPLLGREQLEQVVEALR